MILEIKSNLSYFFPLFADNLFCAPTAKSSVSRACIKQTKEFKKGASLLALGDTPGSIYRLIEGGARLILNGGSNEIRVSRMVEPNEVLGLTEAITNLPYRIDAKTITSCTCECIGRKELIQFLHDEPEVAFRLTQVLGSNRQKSYQLLFSQ